MPLGRNHEQLAVKLGELERKLAGHDHAIRNLFETIRQLLAPTAQPAKDEARSAEMALCSAA